MSELKAMTVLNVQQMGCYDNALVYFKSEADKVIAEKDKEIEEQKRLRDMALASVPNVLKVMKIIQHQKFKRCLEMAKWCERKRIDAADYRIPRQKWEFYEKWLQRWLELAEKFKEAK